MVVWVGDMMVPGSVVLPRVRVFWMAATRWRCLHSSTPSQDVLGTKRRDATGGSKHQLLLSHLKPGCLHPPLYSSSCFLISPPPSSFLLLFFPFKPPFSSSLLSLPTLISGSVLTGFHTLFSSPSLFSPAPHVQLCLFSVSTS